MNLTHEQEWGLRKLQQANTQFVVGIDEVGLGAIAGPLVVCGAVFPSGWSDPQVKDSKKYSSHEARMKVLKANIDPVCSHRAVEIVSHIDVDSLGMHDALQDAIRRCALRCAVKYPSSAIVVDGNYFPLIMGHETVAIPKGDHLVPAVSAASVIAKTTRDAMMRMEAAIYPGYGFENHVGYLTEEHRKAVFTLGPCTIHRRSYEPIKSITGGRR